MILSNYYDLPFNDILDWRKFAVVLRESDVYQLKQILKNISDAEFVSLHNNLVKVEVLSLLFLEAIYLIKCLNFFTFYIVVFKHAICKVKMETKKIDT